MLCLKLVVVSLGAVLPRVLGDLPVHCLRHQVAGDWDFYLGPSGPQRSSCGHHRPDDEAKQPLVALSEVGTHKQVSLSNPNIAATATDEKGRWTMIYDEAFEVKVDGLALLAFSRFDLSFKNGVKSNSSRCGETQLGWYHDLERTKFGCFYAKKRAPAHHLASLLSFVPSPSSKSVSYDQPLDHSYHSAFADSLNMLQDLWTAKPHSRFAGMSLRDMNSMAGLLRSLPLSLQQDLFGNPVPAAPEPPQRPMSFLQVEQRHQRHLTEGGARLSEHGGFEAPTSWDWRNVSGASWLDHVIDQGECGSCYAVATTRMLSARHRIAQKQPRHEAFSISFPLMCSEYSQGCGGGYAFLASKWSHDVGLVPESCSGYSGEASGVCGIQCDVSLLEKRWRADNYHYVGGYYGAASEPEIIRELVTGGPLVASFEPKNDLMYYGGGIYKSVPNQRAEWERVDHAVLLVGFGEDARGQKYWLLQNSWGDGWGEDGFFRIARGSDESGIESIVVSADVVEDTRPGVLAEFARSL